MESNNQYPVENLLSKEEQIKDLRRRIQKAEEDENEIRVLILEEQLRAIERGMDVDVIDIEKKIEARLAEKNQCASTTEKPVYNYYEDEKIRNDIYVYSSELAKYLEKESIGSVLFLDASARKAWIGIDEYWNLMFSEKEKPNFYFINPNVFKTFSFAIRSSNSPRAFESKLTDSKVIEELERKYKALLKDKGNTILVFDTCSHSGDTIRSVKRILEIVGFSDIRVITASRPKTGSGVESAVCFDEHNCLSTCYPFYPEDLVGKDDQHIMSYRKRKKGEGLQARKEIRQIIREHVKSIESD